MARCASKRCATSALALVFALAIGFIAGQPTALAADSASLYENARTLLGDLNNVPEAELTRHQYELVAAALSKARASNPKAEQADSCLMAEAEIYRKLHERFGAAGDKANALARFRTLAGDYRESQWRTEALLTIANLDGRREAEALAAKTAPPEPKAVPVKTTPAPGSTSTGVSSPLPGSPPLATLVRFRGASAGALVPVNEVRHWKGSDSSRVIIEADAKVSFQYDTVGTPERIFVDLLGTQPAAEVASKRSFSVDDPFLERIRVGRFRRDTVRVVLDLKKAVHFSVGWLDNPARFVFELRAEAPKSAPEQMAKAAAPKNRAPAEENKAEQPAAQQQVVTAKASTPKAAAQDGWQVEPVGKAPAAVAAVAAARPVRFDRPPMSASEQLLSTQKVMEGFGDPKRPAKRAPKPTSEEPAARDRGELAAPPKPAGATSTGRRTLVRALGLKVGRIVIDPGHGGKDPGTIGKSGIQEKNIVLDVSKRLAKLLETKLGAEVILTRDDDRFIDRRQRTRLANEADADLFVSVHVNSERSHKVRGAETYYLDLTTDPWALSVASRENAGEDMGIGRLQTLVSKIALTEKVHESREFAEQMQAALHKGMAPNSKGVRNRGVRKAPFTVLIGAEMPSILAEIGFLSNSNDAKLMNSSKARQKMAEHLYAGIAAYARGLGSVQFASVGGSDSRGLDDD